MVSPDRGLHRLGKGIARLEDGIMVLLLAVMIVLAATQIVLRNLFDTGLPWSDALLRILVLWLGLLGAMAATRQRSQIRIDILSRFLPPTARRFGFAFSDLFTAAVCGLLAWFAGRFVMMDYEFGTQAFSGMPAWIAELIIPIGFGIIALRYLVDLVARLRGSEENASS